jgi:hypothetical protein
MFALLSSHCILETYGKKLAGYNVVALRHFD